MRSMKRGREYLAVVLVGALAVVLSACGTPDPTPTPTSPAAQDGSAPTSGALTGFEAEWDALITAAQAEGRLVVSGSGGIGDIAPVYKIWQDKFGIRVTISRGSGRANADRMLAEQGVGRFDVDMVHGGVTTINTRLMPNETIVWSLSSSIRRSPTNPFGMADVTGTVTRKTPSCSCMPPK